MVFYFTGTGNSLYAAKKVQAAIGGELVSIADAMKAGQTSFAIADGERAGIVFPVYFYGMPSIVSDFLSHISFTGNQQPSIFLLLTCGGSTGTAAEQTEKLLAKRNLAVDYKFAVVMPDNYVIMYDVLKKSEEESRLMDGEKAIENCIKLLLNNEPGDHNKIKGFSALSILAGPIYKHGRKTKKFYATDKCVHCGICEKICPVGAIAMKSGKPEWVAARCTQCLACINRCPESAIQYGKSTLKRGRYRNPNVSWK